MKQNKRIFIEVFALMTIAFALFTTCGCTGVEQVSRNSLSYTNPDGVNLDVEGHKDTVIEGLTITKPDGTVIKMDKYTSAANAAAVEQAGAVDREYIKGLTSMFQSMMSRLLGAGPVAVPK